MSTPARPSAPNPVARGPGPAVWSMLRAGSSVGRKIPSSGNQTMNVLNYSVLDMHMTTSARGTIGA